MPMSHSHDHSRAAAIWLFAVAALVFAMVVLGGATRLTESGLSITEWAPVTGVVPPMSHQAWLQEFQRYQRIPQYQLVNRGMTLSAFQGIYWWEWTHRLLGRVVGVAFVIPFVALLASRRIPRRLIWRCWLLLGLGGLQGLGDEIEGPLDQPGAVLPGQPHLVVHGLAQVGARQSLGFHRDAPHFPAKVMPRKVGEVKSFSPEGAASPKASRDRRPRSGRRPWPPSAPGRPA